MQRTDSITDLQAGTILNAQPESEREESCILKDLNLKIKKGSLIAIVGDVGSGKSSFLYSLIGEMKYKATASSSPSLRFSGSLALVNQKPWILNATVKDNIIFGLEFDQEKYDECLHYACLETDLKVLQNGDKTMIGEKGVNLSGGQKARICLARALYSGADVLLLDDILSAVDIHVGVSLVKNCLMHYKKNTTRILVTHALYYMKYMDYIYFLEGGQISVEGTYEEIQKTEKFNQIYNKFMKDKSLEEQKDDLEEEQELREKQDKFQHIDLNKLAFKKDGNRTEPEKSRTVSIAIDPEKKKEQEKPKIKDKYDNLILEEDRKRGKVEWSIYWSFFNLLGGFFFLIPFLIAISSQAFLRIYASIWLTYWTEDLNVDNNLYYLRIYSLLTFGYCIFVGARSAINYFCQFRTARFVHKSMVASLLYAPLNEFFERIPLGRIINRLTKDLQCIDMEIAMAFAMFSSVCFNLLTNSAICIYSSTPFVIIPIVFLIILAVSLLKYYQKAQREVVRLENITKSPILSFFSESLNGLPSIRAYNQQQRFLEIFCHNISENKKNQITNLAMQQWFRFILSVCSLMINVTSLAFCLFSEGSSPSQTGLLLTYAFQIDMNVRFMLIQFASFENQLVSFERCTSYMTIEPEQGYKKYLTNRLAYKKAGIKTHESIQLDEWPSDGVIEFRNVYVRYRSNLEPVLKGLNFIVSPQEKVGIVGRTGAGKSTITLCILRVLELMQGEILVDGFNISKLTLQEIRSKITIILQDPSLFEGTLRENVDPLRLYSDQQILETLYKCNLRNLLESRKGLETPVSDGGENLSVGEKQLICIARALLKKSKLVLIDEATANIDIETEHLIQQTIKEVFKDCTVLTIAHRINTIMGSDRILVMNEGRAEEFDTPKNLLKNSESLFFKLHTAALKENHI